jgi:very-short-patch-repair endonuclease
MDVEIQKERARFLRKNMTDSERKIWSYLSRDHFPQELGFKVLRFWNNDILGKLSAVFDVIERTINDLVKFSQRKKY